LSLLDKLQDRVGKKAPSTPPPLEDAKCACGAWLETTHHRGHVIVNPCDECMDKAFKKGKDYWSTPTPDWDDDIPF